MTPERIAVPNKVKMLQNSDGAFPLVGAKIDIVPVAEAIDEIRRCIIQGDEVPAKYYRKSTGSDELLQQKGLMHLHVGVDIGDDDILLIVK